MTSPSRLYSHQFYDPPATIDGLSEINGLISETNPEDYQTQNENVASLDTVQQQRFDLILNRKGYTVPVNPIFKATSNFKDIDLNIYELVFQIQYIFIKEKFSNFPPFLSGGAACNVISGLEYNDVDISFYLTCELEKSEEAFKKIHTVLIEYIASKLGIDPKIPQNIKLIKECFLYKKIKIPNNFSYFSLGEIELKFILLKGNGRNHVSTCDCFTIPISDKNIVFSNCYRFADSYQALINRIYTIPKFEEVKFLIFRLVHKLSQGFKIDDAETIEEFVLNQLIEDYQFNVAEFQDKYIKHLDSHYRKGDSIGRMIDFLNFLSMALKIKNSTVRNQFIKTLSGVWQRQSTPLLKTFSVFIENNPNYAINLIHIIEGFFLLEWLNKSKSISGAYTFDFDSQKNVPRLCISIKHDETTHYLAIKDSPNYILEKLFESWNLLEETLAKSSQKNILKSFSEELPFKAPILNRETYREAIFFAIEHYQQDQIQSVLAVQYENSLSDFSLFNLFKKQIEIIKNGKFEISRNIENIFTRYFLEYSLTTSEAFGKTPLREFIKTLYNQYTDKNSLLSAEESLKIALFFAEKILNFQQLHSIKNLIDAIKGGLLNLLLNVRDPLTAFDYLVSIHKLKILPDDSFYSLFECVLIEWEKSFKQIKIEDLCILYQKVENFTKTTQLNEPFLNRLKAFKINSYHAFVNEVSSLLNSGKKDQAVYYYANFLQKFFDHINENFTATFENISSHALNTNNEKLLLKISHIGRFLLSKFPNQLVVKESIFKIAQKLINGSKSVSENEEDNKNQIQEAHSILQLFKDEHEDILKIHDFFLKTIYAVLHADKTKRNIKRTSIHLLTFYAPFISIHDKEKLQKVFEEVPRDIVKSRNNFIHVGFEIQSKIVSEFFLSSFGNNYPPQDRQKLGWTLLSSITQTNMTTVTENCCYDIWNTVINLEESITFTELLISINLLHIFSNLKIDSANEKIEYVISVLIPLIRTEKEKIQSTLVQENLPTLFSSLIKIIEASNETTILPIQAFCNFCLELFETSSQGHVWNALVKVLKKFSIDPSEKTIENHSKFFTKKENEDKLIVIDDNLKTKAPSAPKAEDNLKTAITIAIEKEPKIKTAADTEPEIKTNPEKNAAEAKPVVIAKEPGPNIKANIGVIAPVIETFLYNILKASPEWLPTYNKTIDRYLTDYFYNSSSQITNLDNLFTNSPLGFPEFINQIIMKGFVNKLSFENVCKALLCMIKYKEFDKLTIFLHELKFHHFSLKQISQICQILLDTSSLEDQEKLFNAYESLIASVFLKVLTNTKNNKLLLLKLIIIISYISSKKDIDERNRLAVHLENICQRSKLLFNEKFLNKKIKSLILRVYLCTQNPDFYQECYPLLFNGKIPSRGRFVAFLLSLNDLKDVSGAEHIKPLLHKLIEEDFSNLIKQNLPVDTLKKLQKNFAELIKDKDIKFVDITHLKVAKAIIDACLESHSVGHIKDDKHFCHIRMITIFGMAHNQLIQKFATPEKGVLLDHLACSHLKEHVSEFSRRMNIFFEIYYKNLEEITFDARGETEKTFFAKMKYLLPLLGKYSLSYGRMFLNTMVKRFFLVNRSQTKFIKTMQDIIEEGEKLGFYNLQKAESVDERTQIRKDKIHLTTLLMAYYCKQDSLVPTDNNSDFSKICLEVFEKRLKELDINEISHQRALIYFVQIYNMVLIHDLHDLSTKRHEIFLKFLENFFINAEKNITSKQGLDNFYGIMAVILHKILYRTFHLEYRCMILKDHKGNLNYSNEELSMFSQRIDKNESDFIQQHFYYNSKEFNFLTDEMNKLLGFEFGEFLFPKALEIAKKNTEERIEIARVIIEIRSRMLAWCADFTKASAKRSGLEESLFAKILCALIFIPNTSLDTGQLHETRDIYRKAIEDLPILFAPQFISSFYTIESAPPQFRDPPKLSITNH